ncbi:hypothetical protein [Nocardioides sp. GXQ0305]|uniref:hypothetical protein n=1 Tax=Nocardioides sp. GXQ0305 TaxID=3423912 RepID=UPI003D7DA333
MLRGIVSRALGGSRRRTTPGRPTTGRPAGGGSANREIERGARTLLRGVGRKRRGL